MAIDKALEAKAKAILAEWEADLPGDPENTMENALEAARAEMVAKKECKVIGERKERKTPVKRERKVDAVKAGLMGMIVNALTAGGVSNVERKSETETHFTHNGDEYTVKVIRHRKAKK